MAPVGGMGPLQKPTAEQFLADDMQRRSSTMVPSFVRSYDENGYDEYYHVNKSVIAMVKEKARKWTNTLSTRKGGNSTPAWGVSLEEEDDEDDENPQYHGAPLYESKVAPIESKDKGKNCSTPSPTAIGNHIHLLMGKDEEAESKTITESVTNILAPAYAIVSGATSMIVSIIQAPLSASTAATEEKSSPMENVGKGVLVEENLNQKLEQGKEERAFSQENSQSMRTRNEGDRGEKDVVEKVKEAEFSQHGMEEELSKATFNYLQSL